MSQYTNFSNLDNHHNDVFEMIHLLDKAISKNIRSEFEPIIKFLEEHCLEHFDEEETIMKNKGFKYLTEHQRDHEIFKKKIKSIRKMYNENIHTTHVAYSIRQLIDRLITHIQTVDVKMKELND